MRLMMMGLLLGGGGLAALAIAWVLYSTAEPSIQQAQTEISQAAPAADTEQKETTPAAQAAREPEKQSEAVLQDLTDTSQQLSIDIARIGPDGSAVIAGSAPAESEVRLLDGDALLGQTLSNEKGEWVVLLETPLSRGKHLIIAEVTAPDGSVIRSERAVLVELADLDTEKPLVALVPMTGDGATEILSAPEALAQASTAITAEAQAEPASTADILAQKEIEVVLVVPPEIHIGTLSWSDENKLRIKGQSNGGAGVSGSFGSQKFKADTFDDAGNWSVIIDLKGQKTGLARLSVQLIDLDDSIITTSDVEVDMAQLKVGLDGSEMVIIRKGDMLWRIAYRTYGSGIRYLDILKRNARQINNPDLIYPAQVFALPEVPERTQ